jgi:hypothetical protein
MGDEQDRPSQPDDAVSVGQLENSTVITDADREAAKVAAAEHHLETHLPTAELTLAEAKVWLTEVAHSEDLEPPLLVRGQLPPCTEAVATRRHHAIVVASSRPSKLTLLHELAHHMGSMGHGPHFQDLYVGLIRRHLSLQHALLLQEGVRSRD